MRLRSMAPASLIGLAAACGGAPLPTPPSVRLDVAPPPVAVPPPLPARWVESGGATLVGPVLSGSDGTLVLLGGRRALVRGDGSLEPEKARAPEPLEEIVEVPGPGGRTRLVGRSGHGVFRFDDPLGAPVALARSEARI